jgi:hypothetical protein
MYDRIYAVRHCTAMYCVNLIVRLGQAAFFDVASCATLVQAVSRYRNLKILRSCVEDCFSFVGARDLNGRTALHCACQTGLLPLIRYLCVCGSDPRDKDNHEKTPLDFAVVRANEESLSFIRNTVRMFEETSAPLPLHNTEPMESDVNPLFPSKKITVRVRRDTIEGTLIASHRVIVS